MAELTGTLSNYIIRVRRYLLEPNSETSFWSDAFLKQMFNSAYRRRCTQLHLAFEGFFTDVAIRDITANQSRYSWPLNFQKEVKLEIVRLDGSTMPLERRERHVGGNAAIASTGGDGEAYLPNWRPIGSGFVLEPGPSSTVTNGLRMEYVVIPVELTANGDTLHIDFPIIFDELIVLDTAVMALHAEGIQEAPGGGMARSISTARGELEMDWTMWIEHRVLGKPEIIPFVPHYSDS